MFPHHLNIYSLHDLHISHFRWSQRSSLGIIIDEEEIDKFDSSLPSVPEAAPAGDKCETVEKAGDGDADGDGDGDDIENDNDNNEVEQLLAPAPPAAPLPAVTPGTA